MKRGPSLLPPHLSLHPHCILWSILLFTCSYSPFGGDKLLFFFPRNQLLWQSLFFASKKARLRGAKEKECENMPRPRVSLSGPQKRRAGELLGLLCCCAVWMKRAACRRGCFTSLFPPLWPFGITLKVICTCRQDKAGQRGRFLLHIWKCEIRVVLQENTQLGAKVLWAHLIMQPFLNDRPWPPGIHGSLYVIYFIQWMWTGPKAHGGRRYFRSECWDRRRHHLHQEPQTFGENHVAISDG